MHNEIYETVDLLSDHTNHLTHEQKRFDDGKLHNNQCRIVSNVHALDVRPEVECWVNDTRIEIEFDTGSLVSVVSDASLSACNLHLTLSRRTNKAHQRQPHN